MSKLEQRQVKTFETIIGLGLGMIVDDHEIRLKPKDGTASVGDVECRIGVTDAIINVGHVSPHASHITKLS